MIVAFADESGTGGIPANKKEPAPGVCGLLASEELWESFRIHWKAALDHHNAPYFHFRKLDRSNRKDPKNRFHEWSDDRVDDFIYDMAVVASSGPIPFGGNASVKMVHGTQPKKDNLNETYGRALSAFFADFTAQMNRHFPNENSEVSFCFDKNDSPDWIAVLENTSNRARKSDPRIGGYRFVDSESYEGIPCQAADLFAYVNRQNNETVYERQFYGPQRILDIILAKQSWPEWHPFSVLKTMSDVEWRNLVTELRGRRKAFKMQHYLKGTNPLPEYYPIIEHSYFKHLNGLCLHHKKNNPHLWV
jgi:hypothetical protein